METEDPQCALRKHEMQGAMIQLKLAASKLMDTYFCVLCPHILNVSGGDHLHCEKLPALLSQVI